MIDVACEAEIYEATDLGFDEDEFMMPRNRPLASMCSDAPFRFLALMESEVGVEFYADVDCIENDLTIAKIFALAAFPNCRVLDIKLFYEADF